MSMHAIESLVEYSVITIGDRFACSTYGTKTAGFLVLRVRDELEKSVISPALSGAIAQTRAF